VEDVARRASSSRSRSTSSASARRNDRVIGDGGRPRQGGHCCSASQGASLSTRFVHLGRQFTGDYARTHRAASPAGGLLRGLKENVIMGRLIPAGTGLERYRNIEMLTEVPPMPVQEEILPPPSCHPRKPPRWISCAGCPMRSRRFGLAATHKSKSKKRGVRKTGTPVSLAAILGVVRNEGAPRVGFTRARFRISPSRSIRSGRVA